MSNKKPSVGPNSAAAKAVQQAQPLIDPPAPVLTPNQEETKPPSEPPKGPEPSEPSKSDQIRMGGQQLQQQIVTKKLDAFEMQRQYDGFVKQAEYAQAQANALKPAIEQMQLEIGAMEMTLNNQMQAAEFIDPQQQK